ncbi:MAG: type II secretion system F family protein, partial [Candidatus Magasanikbacteria bacterium]|nr:type II secretion system F family protein [Candidatus Magasanikbacteria bacterium]
MKKNNKPSPVVDGGAKSILDLDISFGRVNLGQKVIFAKDLSLMLKSGLVLSEAIEIIEEQSTGKMKKVAKGLLSSIQSGQALSSSLERYPKVFSPFFINIVNAGELSGNLEKNLENIAEQLKKENDLISKIKGALYYPVTVMVAAFFMGLAMAFLVLPKITPLFEGLKVELPMSTRFLIWSSHLIGNYGGWLFLGILAVIIFLVWLLKKKFVRPVTHWLLLKLPVVKTIVVKTNLARFCRTLGALLKSGINIDEAIDITTKALNNYYYKRALTKVSRRVSQGGVLSESLEEFASLFPRITTRMIKVGEKSGNLDETLFYLADSYEAEV